MTKMLVAVVVFAICVVAEGAGYKEYGNYDLRGAVKRSGGKNGDQGFKVDVKLIDKIVADLAAHAKDYPTNFRTRAEKARAELDAALLVDLFDQLTEDKNASAELLLKAAQVDAIAHNLDIPGAAEKAVENYERVLKREPERAGANLNYGIFLAGAGKQKESVPYLEKALKGGADGAEYTLGLVQISLGNSKKAREYLKAHAKTHPEDKRPKELLDAIDSGRFHVKQVGSGRLD
jgi:tetratricopeptide (TPR) repeat protein